MRILLPLICFFSLGLNAATVYDTLYINTGTATMQDNTTFPFKAFNASDQFEGQNKLITLIAGDDFNW